jgi:hypothetical protein
MSGMATISLAVRKATDIPPVHARDNGHTALGTVYEDERSMDVSFRL